MKTIQCLLCIGWVALAAGCAGSSGPAAHADAEKYVEIRVAMYEEAPGFVVVRPKATALDERAYVAPVADLNETDIKSAQPLMLKEEGHFAVGVEFTPRGAKRLEKFTRANAGNYIAFIVDGHTELVTAVVGVVTSGRLLLAGGYTTEVEAADLARRINERVPPENK